MPETTIVCASLPAPVVNAGQLLIGIGLGTRFTPEFFESAPRFLGAVAAGFTAFYVPWWQIGLVVVAVFVASFQLSVAATCVEPRSGVR